MQTKFKAKKSLGQHFLRSEKAIMQIVKAIKFQTTPSDEGESQAQTVFEIGPGEGVLTQKLLEAGHKVIAIEIDKRSIETLEKDLRDYIANGQLRIIERDCLEIDYSLELEKSPFLGGGGFTLVGNIPYYITGAIFRHTFEQKLLPKQAIFLVQKEVAQRVVARDGKESILSVSVKIFTDDSPTYEGGANGGVEIVDIVKAGSFTPAPKVDSAILNIKNILNPFHYPHQLPLIKGERSAIAQEKQNLFFQILKAAFSQKRKFLMSNLKQKLPSEIFQKYETLFIEVFVKKYGEKVRAEDVDINDWRLLINKIG